METATEAASKVATMDAGIKELSHVFNELRKLGVEGIVNVPLPRIVAIGDQSAGKSSIIEAISEIKVPRSTGTCTRCPISISLKTSDSEWECVVTIQKDFDYVGFGRGGRPRSKQAYPGWEPNHSLDEPFEFSRTNDRQAIEDILHRAQYAVLNPGSRYSEFQSGDLNDKHFQVEFSPNTVNIEIWGPNLPTLSFVDLPGVISQVADGRNTHLPTLVQTLVSNYIKSENSLVLLACPMEGDIANSTASGLVRKYGAEPRCIGILTKPDRLPAGDPTDLWAAILKGDNFRLGHGYFVTKQPSQAEMQLVDYGQARRQEKQFFDGKEPWSTDFAQFRDRCGTENLQESLSIKLAAMYSACIPKIEEEIRRKLNDIEQELATMPERALSNSVHIVMSALNTFTDMVSRLMEGMPPNNVFKNKWKDTKREFCGKLFELRPKIHVETPDEGQSRLALRRLVIRQDPILIDSDTESSNPAMVTPQNRRRTQISLPVRTENPFQGDATAAPVVFQLDFILQKVREYSTSNIPNETDPRAIDFLILESMRSWALPASQLLQHVEKAVLEQVREAFEYTLGTYSNTDFFDRSWAITERFLRTHLDVQRDTVLPRLLLLEHHNPSTENESVWEENRLKELAVLEEARFRARAKVHIMEGLRRSGRKQSLAEIERRIKTEENNLRRELGPDVQELPIQIMAKVRGYYNIASNRFCDNLCIGIQVEVFDTIKKDLLNELITGLNALDQEAAALLLVEDQGREAQRRTLKAHKEKLLFAQKCLDDLSKKYDSGGNGGSLTQALDGGHQMDVDVRDDVTIS